MSTPTNPRVPNQVLAAALARCAAIREAIDDMLDAEKRILDSACLNGFYEEEEHHAVLAEARDILQHVRQIELDIREASNDGVTATSRAARRYRGKVVSITKAVAS